MIASMIMRKTKTILIWCLPFNSFFFFFLSDSCKAGTYITEINNVPTCVKCPKGEYQPLKNQNQCLKCDHNSTTVKTGTTKKNRCFRKY